MSQAVNEPAPQSANPESWSLDQVRRDVAEMLYESPEDLGVDEDLLNRGLDSIRLMTLVERWRRLGADLTLIDLAENPSVRGLHLMLDQKLAVR